MNWVVIGYSPRMYQNIHVDRRTETVFVWDDEKGQLDYPMSSFRYAYRKSASGKFKSIYGDILEKILSFNENDPDLFESDIPMETRVLVDLYGDSDDVSKNHRVTFIDIEVDSTGGFPNVEEADKEITAIALYDQLGNQYHVLVLDPDERVSHEKITLVPKNGAPLKIRGFNNEMSLLTAFLNLWEEIAPSIVTGWNSNGFDLPYLYNRLKRELGYKGAKRLSPIGVVYISKWNNSMVIAGVSCTDYMDMVKLFPSKKEPSYTLGYIGKKFVDLDKIHYKGNLNDLYRKDLNRFIEYNFNDVQIVVELDKKLNYIDIARSLCHAGHVPYEYFDASSKYIEGAILMYLRRGTKEIVKNKSVTGREEYQQQMDEGEEGFSGAYVKKPVPGKYHYVFDLDLTSMYPSIIISLNISPETKVGVISRVVYDDDFVEIRRKQLNLDYYESDSDEEISCDDYVEREIRKFNIDAHFRKHIKEYVIGETVYTKEEFIKLIDDSKYSLSSNGVLYRTDKIGVIPSILVDWFNRREEFRKKAKDAFSRGDMAEYAYFDQRQYTIKILLNSVYGVLGLPVFRFYDRDNAEAVTTTGVTIIKTAAVAINEYYKMVLGEEKDYVVYTDTDSCFVSATPIIEKNYPNVDRKDPKAMSEATLEITGEVQIFVNKFFDLMAKHFFNLTELRFELKRDGEMVPTTHRFNAKQELISKTSFWLAKKRYAQLVINKEGKMLDHPELEVKGIDVVRTSFPAKFRTFMEQFLIDLLTGEKTQNQIDSDIINFKKGMKELRVEDLAKNTSVKFVSRNGKTNYNPKNRKPFHFERGTPAQVKAALAYNDMIHHLGMDKISEPIYHGQKIKWVYLKQNKFGIDSIALKADDTDPDGIMEFITQYIDRNALYERELKSKLEDFYKVLNWHYPTESSMLAGQFFDF